MSGKTVDLQVLQYCRILHQLVNNNVSDILVQSLLPLSAELYGLSDSHLSSGVLVIVGKEIEVQPFEDLLIVGHLPGKVPSLSFAARRCRYHRRRGLVT